MAEVSGQLTEAEKSQIQRLRAELAGAEFCQRCDYCQPCIEEIPISAVLRSEDLPPEELLEATVAGAMEKAARCTECGECETRCPFHLPIREMLARQDKRYQAEKIKYGQPRASG